MPSMPNPILKSNSKQKKYQANKKFIYTTKAKITQPFWCCMYKMCSQHHAWVPQQIKV